jgi:hypothetical protein
MVTRGSGLEGRLPPAVIMHLNYYRSTTFNTQVGHMLTPQNPKEGSFRDVIPNEKTKAKLNKTDGLYMADAPDDGLLVTLHNPEFHQQKNLAEQIMHSDREILHALAK